jgi:[ribosomal protein S5]-alanine N-acetyltransferase
MINLSQRLVLETPRLWLVNCDLNLLSHLFQGDVQLAAYLQINIPEKWTEFGEPAFRWAEQALEKNPEVAPWFGYLPVLKAENLLIGSGGFTGPAADRGVVEIGYEIAEPQRGQGLATEVVQALIAFARAHAHIKTVRAHTLPEKNASNAILQKTGFVYVGDSTDPEEGTVWRWELQL